MKFMLNSLLLFMLVACSNASSQVIFETDFANDGNYYASGNANFDYVNVPEGFDGVRTNQGTIQGMPGEGVNGSVALKFDWRVTTTPLAVSLMKHLTGDPNTGLQEVYIRYNVRLPNGFKAGVEGNPGSPLPYWKWGRLWQNAGLNGANWTENRTDSYFIVWNWGNALPKWGVRNNLVFSENLNTNNLGSAGSPRGGTDWYVKGCSNCQGAHRFDGHWDNVANGAWEFDHATRLLYDNTNQTWHTFEWRFKLSTTDTSNDGVFQVWFDGVEQILPRAVSGYDQAVDTPHTNSSLITAAKPGFNLLTVFDNMSQWPRDWDIAEGGIYINDLVISTARIGHDYVVGGTPPADPPPSDPPPVVPPSSITIICTADPFDCVKQ